MIKIKDSKIVEKEEGFTLMELVIVLSIIGIVLAIAIPSLSKTLNSAKVRADEASARTIATACQMALMDDIDENITLANLKDSGYLDEIPKPQVKGKKEFIISVNGEKVEVKYDSGELLYPYIQDKK